MNRYTSASPATALDGAEPGRSAEPGHAVHRRPASAEGSPAPSPSPPPKSESAPAIEIDRDPIVAAEAVEASTSPASIEYPTTGLVRVSSPKLAVSCSDQPADPATGYDSGGDDEVVGLRAWGTNQVVPLCPQSDSQRASSASTSHEETAGTTSALQQAHEALAIAGRGVEVVREGPSWRIRDRDGIAQLRQDGRPTREVSLMPGTELKVAGLTLIAESARSIALRNFCARLLGWSHDRVAVVDQALRSIRLASSGRVALVLRGSGDLVLVARTIHRRTVSDRRPFVVSDPRRRDTAATVRSPANFRLGMDAFFAASHGTLCVRAQRLPPDFDTILRLFRKPTSTVQLMVCARPVVSGLDAFALGAEPIEIPSLQTRTHELAQITREYLEDAIDELQAPAACLNSGVIQWIIDRSSVSTDVTIPDIEKAAVRAVALHMTGDHTRAARLLGMAPVSFWRWMDRRQ